MKSVFGHKRNLSNGTSKAGKMNYSIMPVIMLLSSKRETFFVSFICIFASLVKINVGMILHILYLKVRWWIKI